MRRRAGIVAAPDRAARCTAPRRALTTTTAPGTDTRTPAGVITPQTLHKTVSKEPRTRRGVAGPSAGVLRKEPLYGPVFAERCRALMYSGRPVEGAASGATSGVAVVFFFFCM